MTTQKYRITGLNVAYRSMFVYDDLLSPGAEFDNRDDAVAAAKKLASQRKDDVTIWKIDSVAKFPIPDVEIEVVA